MGDRFKKLVVTCRPNRPRTDEISLVSPSGRLLHCGQSADSSPAPPTKKREAGMSNPSRKPTLAVITLAGLLLSPLAISHFDDKQIPQSYRQSWFAMVAANFGPMVAMVKGEIPWQENRDGRLRRPAGGPDHPRCACAAFPDGSDKGTTRARPELWENKPDFAAKMDDLKTAVNALQEVAQPGHRPQGYRHCRWALTGKACKACHDEYKSEDYLY